jgi:hypothetical protein
VPLEKGKHIRRGQYWSGFKDDTSPAPRKKYLPSRNTPKLTPQTPFLLLVCPFLQLFYLSLPGREGGIVYNLHPGKSIKVSYTGDFLFTV